MERWRRTSRTSRRRASTPSGEIAQPFSCPPRTRCTSYNPKEEGHNLRPYRYSKATDFLSIDVSVARAAGCEFWVTCAYGRFFASRRFPAEALICHRDSTRRVHWMNPAFPQEGHRVGTLGMTTTTTMMLMTRSRLNQSRSTRKSPVLLRPLAKSLS